MHTNRLNMILFYFYYMLQIRWRRMAPEGREIAAPGRQAGCSCYKKCGSKILIAFDLRRTALRANCDLFKRKFTVSITYLCRRITYQMKEK